MGERAIYLLLRLGICAACFAAVLALKLSSSSSLEAQQVLNGVSVALNDEGEAEDELGRLRFVQLPSIIQVFAPSDSPTLPLEIKSFELMSDSNLLVINSTASAQVLSAGTGRVSGIGEDDNLGAYVSIMLEDDTEVFYYGVSDICVEEGQPVAARTVLGAAQDESIIVRVYKAGRPIDPLDFFEVKAG